MGLSKLFRLFWRILMAVAVIFFLLIVGYGILDIVQKKGGSFFGGWATKIGHAARGDELS